MLICVFIMYVYNPAYRGRARVVGGCDCTCGIFFGFVAWLVLFLFVYILILSLIGTLCITILKMF